MGSRFSITIIVLLCVSSCGNLGHKEIKSNDDIQEVVNNIVVAIDKEDFKEQQVLSDDLYSKICDIHHYKAKTWLSREYFFLCCYNGGSEDDVKMKMELYTEKYTGVGALWHTVKDMDAVWFSNIERCAGLILSAYKDNPSRTKKFIDENEFEAYQTFARIVLSKQ